MIIIKTYLKKLAPFAVAAAVLTMGGVAIAEQSADDCCALGAPCCHPGSPCCAHAKHP